MTFKFSWVTGLRQEGYVNHTTMIDTLQSVKGLILQTNLSGDASGRSPCTCLPFSAKTRSRL
jgi:hypothetical protein